MQCDFIVIANEFYSREAPCIRLLQHLANKRPHEDKTHMAKAGASVDELVGRIERGELRLPEMQRQ
jgi:hypothetical protein